VENSIWVQTWWKSDVVELCAESEGGVDSSSKSKHTIKVVCNPSVDLTKVILKRNFK